MPSLNYGYNDGSIPQFNFTNGFGNTTPVYGMNSLNSYGMPSPTSGSGISDLGGTLGTTDSMSGVTNGPLTGSGAGTLGFNVPTLQLGLGGISTLAGLYTGLKSLGLAQSQFNLQKQIAQANLGNSVASYNTALTDKATARGVAEGQSSAQVNNYINANKLST
jgi:hypothetical protein